MARYKIDASYSVAIGGVQYQIGPGEVELDDWAMDYLRRYYPGVHTRLRSLDDQPEPETRESVPEIEETGDTDFDDLKSAIVKALNDNEMKAFYSSSGKPKPSYFSKVLGRPVPRSMLEEAFDEVMRERGDAGE